MISRFLSRTKDKTNTYTISWRYVFAEEFSTVTEAKKEKKEIEDTLCLLLG